MSATIRPRYREDAYPIGRLILDRANSLGLSRTDLARRFGYRDLNSGHRALAKVLLAGIVPPFIQEKLADAIEVDKDFLDAVLLATARQHHDEVRSQILAREDAYRAAFRPHLQVETERTIPSPIFIAALLTTRRLRIVPLPEEALSADDDTRDRVISTTIIEHYQSQRGHVPAFGGITRYLLVLLPGYDSVDFGLPYDVSGNPIGPMREVRRLPEATLGTKRGDTRLTGVLKDTPIEVISMGPAIGCKQRLCLGDR